MRLSLARTLCGALICAFLACALPAHAQSAARVVGLVVDAASGVALSGALVRIVGTSTHTVTDARGAFAFKTVGPGTYRLEVEHQGYQPALSLPVWVDTRSTVRTTLALQRATGGLHVITVTSTTAGNSLQQSSAFTQSLDSEALQAGGVQRAGDALRQLPGVNNGITGDTAALGDDINLNVRGIGTAETVAALDGDPIGYGIKGGYNYQLSPLFPFRDVQVLYGSGGSDLLGINAIGGVVNFQTLDPTPTQEVSVMQGYGTFERQSTNVIATGSTGKLGYALAYGVSGLDGPLRNAYFYQVGAQASYIDDSSVTSRANLIKLTYAPDSKTNIVLTGVNSSYWENKTGNGDGDYLPYPSAYATCVASGSADPAQCASQTTGWQGAGPAWQAFNFGYQDATVSHRFGEGTVSFNGFTTLYDDTTYRLNLPTPVNQYLRDYRVRTSGSLLGDDFAGADDDFAFGYNYFNNAYVYSDLYALSPKKNTYTAPYSNEGAFFIREVWQAQHSPLTAFFNVWARHASETDSSYLDPRLSLLYRTSPRDVVRAAFGATTTEPTSDELDLPFQPGQLADGITNGTGGGATYTCGALNSIGSVPSADLKPERGVDEEAAWGHTWFGDSITQLQLYNVDVYDKLYSSLVPLSQAGAAGINPSYLAAANQALTGVCGANNYTLGVTGTVNIGTLQARGADLSGRQRISLRLYIDYDWALTSSVLENAPPQYLEANLTSIVGSQIKGVPLHTANVAVDNTFGVVDARYTIYTVSINNTKDLPAYDYSDLRLTTPISRNATFTIAISNVFNQYANIAGLIGEGVPAPLNSYASVADYAPYIGKSATEWFGLPYRQVYFSLQFLR
ncbi:MAG TPA: TonB-dependent receptor [Candidatus Baltobacteraceae bacterium]|nr:TonB-dependent receptor [Candidatus Baltobacteraceae bacterium]